MSAVIIGLTGGIASGKSEAGRQFAALGVPVIDADTVAREVVAPGTPGLAAITARFGAEILQPDGQLDRAALRRVVFADADARRDLEGITHPAIRQSLLQQCREAPGPYAVAAIPLLAEAGRERYPWLSAIVVVDVPESIQQQRLLKRDAIDVELAQRMIAAQASRSARLAIADHVIDNRGTPEDLVGQVARLHALFIARAPQSGSQD